jgi:hypothetical protein
VKGQEDVLRWEEIGKDEVRVVCLTAVIG